MKENKRTITAKEYLHLCASAVASSVANPYGTSEAVVEKCRNRIDILLADLGFEVIED